MIMKARARRSARRGTPTVPAEAASSEPTGAVPGARLGTAHAPQGSAVRVDAAARDELAPVFEAVARYFGLLAEPMRLSILHALCQEERAVSDIVAATGATQSNVSRHLGLMLSAGVVARRRQGSQVCYRLVDPEFAEICRRVCVRIAGQIQAGEPLRRDLLEYASGRESRDLAPRTA
jgi:DNA-binding transcriptional ArsR family regulator